MNPSKFQRVVNNSFVVWRLIGHSHQQIQIETNQENTLFWQSKRDFSFCQQYIQYSSQEKYNARICAGFTYGCSNNNKLEGLQQRYFSYQAQEFNEKVVVVTGASSGIGKGIAGEFAKQGAKVVLAANNEAELREVAQDIEDQGGHAIAIPTDVRSVEQNQKLFSKVIDAYGHIDVTCLNAGAMVVSAIGDIKEEDYYKVFDTNVKGVLFGLKYSLATMKNQKKGSIIVTSSVASQMVRSRLPLLSVYSSSKSALDTIVQTAAVEGSPCVRVNSVNPGQIYTNFVAPYINKDDMDKFAEQHTLVQRSGVVDDIIPLVLYLASERSGFVTGANMVIDGGLRLG